MGALTHAITRRLTLVQGPLEPVKRTRQLKYCTKWCATGCALPILATSDSNIAVDNLLEGLANVGVHVIRVGRPESIRADLLDTPGRTDETIGGYGKGGNQVANAEMRSAQVICATAIGSGSDMLDRLAPHCAG